MLKQLKCIIVNTKVFSFNQTRLTKEESGQIFKVAYIICDAHFVKCKENLQKKQFEKHCLFAYKQTRYIKVNNFQ